MSAPTLTTSLADLLQTYADLNPHTIDEVDAEPSPLEFMRYVARNSPFVVRGGAAHWPATRLWGHAEYLVGKMGGRDVNVAVTPYGNADSVVVVGDEEVGRKKKVFVKPLEVRRPFGEFFEDVRRQEDARDVVGGGGGGHVEYAQSQNDNLRGEYEVLMDDVEADIAWARIALQKTPDAINLWIGSSRSVTALHKDNYENIYCQIVGQKHFVLLPPVAVACVEEEMLDAATYVRRANGGDGKMVAQEDRPPEKIPVPTCDPDDPETHTELFSSSCRPVRVTLHPGDMLYLPALW
ncbi:MAG: hypothetical protein M1816_007125 [Peltula sp. TS41687]|nr:MAG: hypothetical protein M1816_007125 [Peltula sp. TS41687]